MNYLLTIDASAESANNVTSFVINTLRTFYENFVITKEAIRNDLIKTLAPLYVHLKYAVTFSMKQVARIRTLRFENYKAGGYYERSVFLTESIAKDQLKYFIKRLTHYAYGAAAKRTCTKDKCIPIVVPSIEGGCEDKRMHLHLAIGNLPDMPLEEARDLILRAWKDCDFSYKENDVQEIYKVDGWVKYMTKGRLFSDKGLIEMDCMTYPESIEFKEVKYLQFNESSSALELR